VIEGGCEVRDFELEEVLRTAVRVDRIHTLLFAIESFDQLYEAMHAAENWAEQRLLQSQTRR
jgi:phenylalanine-4-hydroxylase